MWHSRDRLLAAMFAVQLGTAVILGLVVVSGLSNQPDATQLSVADDGAVAGTVGGATTGGAAPGDPATAASGSGAGAAVGTPGSAAGGGAAAGDAASTGTGGGPKAAGKGGDGEAASGGGTRTGVTDSTVKIGVLVTQTGAINFRSSAQATRAYIDMVNEQGGVHGRRIEVLLRDDGLDENKGQQAVQEMIDAGVFSFVAFNAPLTEQSILPVLDKHGIPLVGAFAIPEHRLAYMFSAPYETYGKVGGDMVGKQGTTTPGLVFISNQQEQTDNTIVESFRLGMRKHGLELRNENVHAVDVTKASFDDVVISLRSNGVDGIGTILDATAMVRLQQSMNRAAYHPIHVSSPFGGDPAVLENPNVGDSFEGTFVLSDVEFLGSSAPGVQQYEQQVRRRFGGQAEINWAGEIGWVHTKAFVDALVRAGEDPTREKLLAAMNSLKDYETGFTVPLTVTEDPGTHVRANSCMKVGRVANGKVQQVQDWTCPKLTIQTM